MFGTSGLERAHAADEHVAVADVMRVARALVRLILRFDGHQAGG
jgi:acetylornithine deacetylase/succinyl-diaminopimelate desuccinylase-like protein